MLNDILTTEVLSRALISNLPGGAAFVVDRNLRYLLAEGEALAIAGFKSEDFVGKTIFEVLPRELATTYEVNYRKALAGEPFEHEHHAHDRFYISRGTPLRSGNGEVYGVMVVSYDITERRKAEAAAAADLKDMQRLHELSARLVVEDDIQTLYQEIVAAAIALTRADAGSIQILEGATQDLVLLATQGITPVMIEHFHRVNASSNTPCGMALTTGKRTFVDFDVPESEDPHGSMRMHLEAGLLSAQSTPLITRSGKAIGMFSTHWCKHYRPSDHELRFLDLLARQAADLIEQRQAEITLRESEIQRVREQSAREQERQRAETLAELDRAKTLFFSNVSHEFRTPLTLLLSPLQEVLSDGSLPPIHREQLELVQRNSLRLLKLVNTLLDFSRIEAGRMEAIYEPTDLAAFTTELAGVFRSAIEQAGLQFRVDCPPLPEPVYVDQEMWEKIVLNLLSNAFKFTLDGDITVRLGVGERKPLQDGTIVDLHSTSDLNLITANLNRVTSETNSIPSEVNSMTSDSNRITSETNQFTSEINSMTSETNRITSEMNPITSDLNPITSETNRITSSSNQFVSTSNPSPAHPQRSIAPLHVILEVRDTGTGIAPEHLPHLFERFYQVRGTQARTHEGSGIGLALVHELVRLQGGTIEVNSVLGEGTCFTVSLPFGTDHLPHDRLHLEGDRTQPTRTLASTAISAATYVQEAARWLPTQDNPEQTIENAEAPTIQLADSPFPALASARVLVVDDNADMREYLTHILSAHVQVEAVADGVTALTIAQERVPSLILSDVMMPGLDGFELLQALRSNPRTKEIPIILLSARAGEEAIVEGLDAGADDYLIKPFSAQELISRVTTHLQMAQLRKEALQQERILNRRKDEFMSVVSHELNTPLVSILGWTRMLRSSPASPALLSKALTTIERNATLQAKLVQDLLDISRITADKLRLHPEPIDLQSIIETAIATVAQSAEEKSIDLTWQETVPEPIIVMGDRDRLTQVLINLLTNAIKFTPKSGSITLKLSTLKDSEDISAAEIRVTDTGMGIAADFLPQIFDRFRQVDSANAAKGLGLGLAIARHLLELHQGTIHAESAGEGQGATFIVRLPRLTGNP